MTTTMTITVVMKKKEKESPDPPEPESVFQPVPPRVFQVYSGEAETKSSGNE